MASSRTKAVERGDIFARFHLLVTERYFLALAVAFGTQLQRGEVAVSQSSGRVDPAVPMQLEEARSIRQRLF
jgi:hypothetical protein